MVDFGAPKRAKALVRIEPHDAFCVLPSEPEPIFLRDPQDEDVVWWLHNCDSVTQLNTRGGKSVVGLPAARRKKVFGCT